MKFELIPITSIEKKQYCGKVYDLTVENKHSYNINGIAVHNSVCITRTETGVYYPMASSVMECADEAAKMKKPPLLIADGGIQMPADLAKCLALGADIAMAGGIFAGTKEAPGGTIKDKDGHLFKLYRGAASFGVQKEHSGEEPAYNEGNETLVPYKSGGVEKVVERFKAGLRSSLSYMNARNLDEFKNNSDIVII
jgi:IMP dehydrogenase